MHITVSVFDNVKDNTAVRETLDFDAFLEEFRVPLVEKELAATAENVKVLKQYTPAFSPAIFIDDKRKKLNVEAAQVLAYDIDQAVDARELSDRLRRRGISFAIHHTLSAGFSVAETGRGSVRVLIPLSRPVDHDTYLRFWDETRSLFHGIEIDMSKRGAESLFFAPKIFAEHQETYYFDCVTDAPCLGASGFKPLRDGSLHDYVRDVREARQKHVVLNKSAYVLGLLGWHLEAVKAQLLQALRDNIVSEPVLDWDAAEHTIERAWEDGAAQRQEEEARPRFVPARTFAIAEKVLASAQQKVQKGGSVRVAGYEVGRFVPHCLEQRRVTDLLTEAWKASRGSTATSLGEAVHLLVQGLEAGRRAPRGLYDEWKKKLRLAADGISFHAGEKNVFTCIEEHPDLMDVITFDVRENAPMYRVRPPWAQGETGFPKRVVDADRQRIASWVSDELQVPTISVHSALLAVRDYAHDHPSDAFLDYLRGLPNTGEVDLLETWLIRLIGAEDTPYVRAVTKRWLISVVARQFVPGSKADHMLILVGRQGCGKSTLLRELFPERFQHVCFTDHIDIANIDKDEAIKLSRFAVCEVAELAALKRADIEIVKAVVSQQRADLRAAYASLHDQYPFRAVWAGSTNKEDFLRDVTGHRRFWPVPVRGTLDRELVRSLRDALWSQAVSAYLRGERWHLTAEEESWAREVQEEHEEVDPYLEVVRELVGKWDPDSKFAGTGERTLSWQLDSEGKLIYVRLGQLLGRLGVDLSNRVIERRISDCLRKLGWVTRRIKKDGLVYRVWYQLTLSD